MIRDPSDGSVREKPKTELPGSKPNSVSAEPNSASGLPPISKSATQLARLERDREWLKNYLHRKSEGTDAK
jgi:hypothetical protein